MFVPPSKLSKILKYSIAMNIQAMNALQVMDRNWKEVIQMSTRKNDIKVQYLYDRWKICFSRLLFSRFLFLQSTKIHGG